MKDKLNVLRQCIKNNNISQQMDNVEFTEESIIVFSNDGNMILTNNITDIVGCVDGVSLYKIINSFNTPNFIDSQELLIVKEGKRKATIPKYILSGGEESYRPPDSDNEKTIKITEDIKNSIELNLFSAQGNCINNSGDGVILDCTLKFPKIYSTNSKILTLSNVFVKDCKDKVFIPLFIAKNIVKYFKKGSHLAYCDDFVSYKIEDFLFISLCEETEDSINVHEFISKVKTVGQEIKLNTVKDNFLNIVNLTDQIVTIEFKENHIKITGEIEKSVIEETITIDNTDNSRMVYDKNYIKYAIENFESMFMIEINNNKALKFKQGKNTFIVSPMRNYDAV